jgi:hypothetical protein
MPPTDSNELVAALDHLDAPTRRKALDTLWRAAREAKDLPPTGLAFNLHAHSFFSYNGYGYSPSGLAWRGRQAGLYAMGLVDFDVLDGVAEFLGACQVLGMRGCAGLETRVFVPEFADRVINSPGEPGIAYHMGAGFVSETVKNPALLERLRSVAGERTRGLVARVNTLLAEIALDYDADVAALTPRGNATERHVCAAYDTRARTAFPDPDQRCDYWAGKLGASPAAVAPRLDDPPGMQALIRSKTMKAGGVGYVQPAGPDFPRLDEVNAFILSAGAIPTFAWLDGTSAGEQCLDELLDVMVASGVAAVNIIPDRNWNIADPAVREDRVKRLYQFVAAAQARHLPILVGTEMNAHGQRFVDDLNSDALQPLYHAFRSGADILHAHTLLEAHAGMGYTSAWAKSHFNGTAHRNAFYEAVGAALLRIPEGIGAAVHPAAKPAQIASAIGITVEATGC